MNLRITATLFASLVLSCLAAAQNGAPADAQATGQVSATGQTAATASTSSANSALAAGTAFNVTLERGVDSKKLRVGDAVVAQTTEDVRVDGKTIIPKGSKLVGRVTQTKAKSSGDAESELAIVFEKAELKGKQEMPIYANIQAIAAPMPPPVSAGADGNFATDGRIDPGGQHPIGGVAPNVGSVPGATINSATDSANNAARSTIDAAGRPVNEAACFANNGIGGVDTNGQIALNSRGVFGINGIALKSPETGSKDNAMITSTGKSVRLEEGTRLLLMSRAQS